MFSLLALTSVVIGSVAAQSATGSADIPLASKTFSYNDLPYQVDTDPTGRGPQSGYNICNSTTQNQESQCQTAIINSLSDFCLWGPPTPNSEVGDTEAASVAWCTQATHGTRVIPAGALTAVQFLVAPAYIQVTGLINQGLIDEDPADSGGELDPHGADGRGNPLGALVFSNFWGGSYTQVVEWNSFMGSGQFCFKACNPSLSAADQLSYCNNIFDEIGCAYNAPAAYAPDVFESCLSDNQIPVGLYTNAQGATVTYVQPSEVVTMPYTASIPASSSCTTYSSAQLWSNQPSGTAVSASVSATATTTNSGGITTSKASSTGTAKSTATTTGAATNAAALSAGDLKLGSVIAVAVGVMFGALVVL